jgi:hypothetical protein
MTAPVSRCPGCGSLNSNQRANPTNTTLISRAGATTATGASCSANRMKMSASGESEQGGFDEVPGRVGDRPGEDQPGDQQSGRPLRSRDEVDELFDAPE